MTGHESGVLSILPPMQEASARTHRVQPSNRLMRIYRRSGRFISPSIKRHGFQFLPTRSGPALAGVIESGAHPIAVARVVVVVRVAAGVDIVEVVGIVDIGIALPPVVDSTSARECFVEINLLGITFLCRSEQPSGSIECCPARLLLRPGKDS